MSGVNKVILIGRLRADPESRQTAGGKSVTNIRLATSEAWKDKQTGEPQERTEWHSVVFFNRVAEIASLYLRKGSMAYVEGRLQTEKYTDKQGIERYATKICADVLQLLGSKNDSPEQDRGRQGPQGGGASRQRGDYKDGVERYSTDIIGDDLQLLGGADSGQSQGAVSARLPVGPPRSALGARPAAPAQPAWAGEPSWQDFDDKCPF